MRWQGEELVRVGSFDELRAGMVLVMRRCSTCGRDETMFLTRMRASTGVHVPDGTACPRGRWAWGAVGGCGDVSGVFCFCEAIPDGRLYRLKERGNETSLERRRELEDVGS